MRFVVLASILLAIGWAAPGRRPRLRRCQPAGRPLRAGRLFLRHRLSRDHFRPGRAADEFRQHSGSVAADGDHWRVASREPSAGSLAMSLERSAVGVDGSAWGTLTQPGISVTLQHQVSGAADGPSAGVVGSVAGTVNYAGVDRHRLLQHESLEPQAKN